MDDQESRWQRKKSLNSRTRLIKSSLNCLLAVLCLFWVFHDVRVGELLPYLSRINWGLVALAVVTDVLSYVCQAWRWQLLLSPAGRITLLRSTQAIYAGLFANEVLPLRPGELVRAYLVSRWISVRTTGIIPSIVAERLIDGIWLTIGVGITALFATLPNSLLLAGEFFGVLVLVSTVLFILLIARKQNVDETKTREAIYRSRWIRSLRSVYVSVRQGLRQIGTTRKFYQSFAVSLLYLILQIAAVWLVMCAYGFRLSFWQGAVVFLIVHLGTAIPNAPANVGTYQFFTVLGLSLFSINKTAAAGFSLVVFAVLTLPLWALGFLALERAGQKIFQQLWGELGREPS